MKMSVLLGMMPGAERPKIRRMVRAALGKGLDMVHLVTILPAEAAAIAVTVENEFPDELPIRRIFRLHRGKIAKEIYKP